MTRFGFQVHQFEVKQRGRGQAMDFAVPRTNQTVPFGDEFATRLHQRIQPYLGHSLDWRPSTRDIAAGFPTPAIGTPRLHISSATLSDRRLRLKVTFGHVGEYPEVVEANGAATSIITGAASKPYRIDFYFPPNVGSRGVAVLETIGAGAAYFEHLLLWLARIDALAEGQLPKTDVTNHSLKEWYKISTTPIADREHLLQLLQGAKKVRVRFSASPRTTRGRRAPKDLEMTVNQLTEHQTTEVASQILAWLDSKNKALQVVDDLMQAVNIEPQPVKDANLVFNRADVQIIGSEQTTISPEHVDDVFTYPILFDGDENPSAAVWSDKTESKARTLSEGQGIPIEWD